MNKLPHDGLAQSLAAHLRTDRRMTWCDVQLGAAGSPRPDVYAIFKSYANPCPTAYEVKVSASDFRGDVTAGKWQSYLKYACGVYFACQDDLITKKDLPEHCGLMVFKESWRIAKKAVLSPVRVPQEALLKLIIDGVEREGPRTRSSYFDYSAQEKIRKQFGEVVASTICDRLAVEHEISSAHLSAARIVADAQRAADRIRSETTAMLQPLRAQLCEILSLPADTEPWQLAAAVATLRAERTRHPAVAKLQLLVATITSAVQRAGVES